MSDLTSITDILDAFGDCEGVQIVIHGAECPVDWFVLAMDGEHGHFSLLERATFADALMLGLEAVRRGATIHEMMIFGPGGVTADE